VGEINAVISFEKVAYGWFCWVPEVRLLKERIPLMREFGYSKAFINLMVLASKQGCGWLMLDRDAEPAPGLPTFDW
jgi:hypothetical protein